MATCYHNHSGKIAADRCARKLDGENDDDDDDDEKERRRRGAEEKYNSRCIVSAGSGV